MKTFVTLDTNILIRYVTQAIPGCEPEQLHALTKSVEDESVILLVTEILKLEFQKEFDEFQEALDTHMKTIAKEMPKAVKVAGWNELDDLPSALTTFLLQWKNDRLTAAKARRDEILNLLGGDKKILIEFSPEIMFAARKRMLCGEFKRYAGRHDADCYLIQSLVHFFNNVLDEKQLLICTDDKDGFGVEKLNDLHPKVQPGLPTAKLFNDLATLNKFISEQKPVEITPPEVIEKAIEAEKADELDRAAAVYHEVTRSEQVIPRSLLAEISLVNQMQIEQKRMKELYAVPKHLADEFGIVNQLRADQQRTQELYAMPKHLSAEFAMMKQMQVEQQRMKELYSQTNPLAAEFGIAEQLRADRQRMNELYNTPKHISAEYAMMKQMQAEQQRMKDRLGGLPL